MSRCSTSLGIDVVKKSRGRPISSEGRVNLHTTVPPYVRAWLRVHGIAQTIRRLVDEDIAREKERSRLLAEENEKDEEYYEANPE